MTKQVQRRRGTSSQHTSFTGAEGEISVNTTNKSVHVHDGITAGGVEAARADLGNVSDANLNSALAGNTLPSLTITSADINGGTIDGTVIGGSTPAAISATILTPTGQTSGTGSGVSISSQSTQSYELRADSFDGLASNTRWRQSGSSSADIEWLWSGTDATNRALGLNPSRREIFGADYLAFATGSTIGSTAERMRITSAGEVGIGTSSPSSALTVQGTITGTAVTQSDTDTTAGRLLKVGDFGLGKTTAIPSWPESSVDTIAGVGTGFYNVGASAGAPSFGPMLYMRRITANNAAQMQFASDVFYRNAATISAGVADWGPFRKMYDQANILGTVSQSSGVPTGAIIERGSNANGTFVKFADGTQICYVTGRESRSATGLTTTSVTLPASFIDENVQPDGQRYSAHCTLLTTVPNTATSVGLASLAATSLDVVIDRSSTANTIFAVVVHGRWY